MRISSSLAQKYNTAMEFKKDEEPGLSDTAIRTNGSEEPGTDPYIKKQLLTVHRPLAATNLKTASRVLTV